MPEPLLLLLNDQFEAVPSTSSSFSFASDGESLLNAAVTVVEAGPSDQVVLHPWDEYIGRFINMKVSEDGMYVTVKANGRFKTVIVPFDWEAYAWFKCVIKTGQTIGILRTDIKDYQVRLRIVENS